MLPLLSKLSGIRAFKPITTTRVRIDFRRLSNTEDSSPWKEYVNTLTEEEMQYKSQFIQLKKAQRFTDASNLFNDMKTKKLLQNDTAVHNSMLDILSKSRKYNEMMSFFEGMKNSGIKLNRATYEIVMGGVTLYSTLPHALEFLEEILKKKIPLTNFSYSLLLEKLLKEDNVSKVISTLQLWTSYGVILEESIYRRVIAHLLTRKDDQHLLDIIRLVKTSNIKLDVKTFTHTIDIMGRKSNTKESILETLSIMREKGLEPDKSTLIALIRAFSTNGDTEQMIRIYESLRSKNTNLSLGNSLYTKMITSLKRKNDIEGVLRIFDFMKKDGEIIDVITYNSLLDALRERPEIMEIKFKEMIHDRITPNTLTFNYLLQAYVDVNNIERMKEIIQEMKNRGVKPEVVTFNMLIGVLSRLNDDKGIEEILLDMEQYSLHPNISTFNSILQLFSNREDLKRVINTIEEMKSSNIQLNVYSYISLMSVLGKKNKLDQLLNVWEEMKRSHIRPTVVIYSILISSFGRIRQLEQMKYFFEEMRQQGIAGDSWTYTALIDSYAHAGKTKEMIEYYEEMKKESLLPKDKTYEALINGYTRANDMKGVYDVIKEMERVEFTITNEIYQTLLESMANLKQWDTYLDILQQIKVKQFHCSKALINTAIIQSKKATISPIRTKIESLINQINQTDKK